MLRLDPQVNSITAYSCLPMTIALATQHGTLTARLSSFEWMNSMQKRIITSSDRVLCLQCSSKWNRHTTHLSSTNATAADAIHSVENPFCNQDMIDDTFYGTNNIYVCIVWNEDAIWNTSRKWECMEEEKKTKLSFTANALRNVFKWQIKRDIFLT